MMRTRWGGLCAAILLMGVVSLTLWSAPAVQPEAASPVRLLAVKGVEQPAGTALLVLASGPFSFTAYQPNEQSLILDLTGVVSDLTPTTPTDVAWMGDFRLLPFRNAGGNRVLRFDISLKQACTAQVTQPEAATLAVTCTTAGSTATPVARTTTPVTTAATATTPAPATESTPTEAVEVRRVVVRKDVRAVTVEVQASGPLHFETQTLSNPTRLVVDLPESVLVSPKRQIPIDQEALVGVRVAQFKADPPITRLVVDLREMVPYDIQSTPDGLKLSFTAESAPSQSQATPAAAAPDPVPAAETAATSPAEPPSNMVASLAPMVPASVGASLAPSVKPVEVAAATPPPATPAPAMAAPAAEQMESQSSTAMPMQAKPTQRYTGEPISVNLKDVDLKDFFRLVHEISGLNIIVDPNVKGTVTMVLMDVPWDQALDIVLKNNGLGSTLEGNVLRIATLSTLKKEQEDRRDLEKARAEAVDPVTVTRTLSYAKASDFETTLKRFLSSRGEIIRDDRTNTLIIRDIPSVIPEIDNLIQQLDRKSLQVEIEARVVSASRAFMREVGSQLATSFKTTGGRSVFGGALGPSPLGSADIPPLVANGASNNNQPLVSNLGVGTATSGFLFGHRSPNFALDAILTAAETRNIAKVLSKPRLVTQNNVTAEVKQGTRIPVQTVVNNTISTQFIDVVLRLNVTPQITADGTVFLNIVIENTTIDSGIARINGIPALATQSTTTQVLIPDGGTVVVGGVMVTNNATTIDQVPLFGSIPIIGHLFKRTRVDTSTQELLFFITPRILPS